MSVDSVSVLCCMYVFVMIVCFVVFFFKQKTAYEMRISDWSSDVCSSDLPGRLVRIRDRSQGDGVENLDPAILSLNDAARSELAEQHVYPLPRHPDQDRKSVV